MSEAVLPASREFADDPFRRTYRIALFFVLFSLCCFIRLWDLGYKSMMHDETLFVKYTYEELYQNFTYRYQPILHGPLMLLWQDVVFHVFGVSDYTARLGCSLLGIFTFFFIWKLRYWLGEAGTWFALAFYALSPGIAFFHRFFHNDALFLFNTMWIVCSLANWWRTRDGRWGASALLAITALFTNKASAVFVYFSLVTFFALYIVHDLVSYLLQGKDERLKDHLVPAPRFPGVLLVGGLVALLITLVITQVFEGISYEQSVTSTLGHDWALRDIRSIPAALGWEAVSPRTAPDAGGAASNGFWRMFYAALFGGSILLAGLFKFSVDRRIGRTEFLTHLWRLVVDTRWFMIGGLLLSFFFYLAIYTTLFTHQIGPFEIYKMTWAYWGGQHDIGRIAGPFHQHMLNILIYETPSFLIVSCAWLYGLFRIRWSSATGVAFLLMAIAVGAFQKLIFSGLEHAPDGGEAPVLMGIGYLKSIFGAVLIAGIASVLFPKAGRTLLPLALLLLVGYSVIYLSSDGWNSMFTSPIYRDGQPIMIMKRHMTLKEFMEIRFNFDGGWTLALVLVLVFFATIHAWHALEKGERFHAFLVWWTVTAIGAASYAREAVPQVGIHAMMPTILLAASYVNKFFSRPHTVMVRNLAIASLGLMFLWNTKSTMNLNLRNADDPRERMAYGPNNRDVKAHLDFVRKYGEIASLKMGDNNRYVFLNDYNDRKNHKDVKIYMRPLDQVSWPAKWYLRDLAYTEGSDPSTAIKEGWHFLFLEAADLDRYPEIAEKYHVARGRGTTFWTPNPISTNSLMNIWKDWIPGHYLKDANETEARQARLDWWRIWRYLMFRETFEGSDRPYPSVSTFEYVFCYRKDLF